MDGRATKLQLLKFSTIPMRAFHLTWMAFFVCFFAWFAVAPLMPLIRQDLGLSKDQIANINIAAVFVTIFVRLLIGPICDRFGPRLAYTWLLALGAIPVIAISFAQTYEVFLFWRLCIGAIGASFVITQVHTSVMFAPNVVGAANATAAGWGNAGGGATQAAMPLLVSALVYFGVEQSMGWRVALFVPGILMLIMAVVYFRYVKDTPRGNLADLAKSGDGSGFVSQKKSGFASFMAAARNYRVWLLFLTYGACFGVELNIHNIAAVYFVDRFGLSVTTAGLYVGGFGLLALFARALGGLFSDRIAHTAGLQGRTTLLFAFILAEGAGLAAFSQMPAAETAFIVLMIFGFFTHMACGATYSIVPFIDRKALGGVAGIIGAGGNVGAVAAGFLIKSMPTTQQALFIMGIVVAGIALCALLVRFSKEHQAEERELYAAALASRSEVSTAPAPAPVAVSS